MTGAHKGHGEHCDGCLLLGYVDRAEKAEARLAVVKTELERSFAMSAVNADPHKAWREAVAYVKEAIQAVLPSDDPPKPDEDDVVHWIGEPGNGPTSLHGNGAASFARASGDEGEVTCTLCLTLLDRLKADILCWTPGCNGDARYAAPGRGHIETCRWPAS